MQIQCVTLVALVVGQVYAQQLSGTQMFVDYPGISDPCKEALATNITCPPALAIWSLGNPLLSEDEVHELCVEGCQTSLKTARAAIAAACTADTDVIVYEDVAYPATFIADNYLFTYEVSCFKDASGTLCEPQFFSWASDSSSTMNSTNQCSDCWIGVLALQLGNPLGYDAGLETSFESLTSSCNATGYSYTTPTAYALNNTATATSAVTAPSITPMRDCVGTYTVQPGDNCNSVAKAHKVSTYALLQANNLDLYCENFSNTMNRTLCIPSQCETYTWRAYDTCNDIAAGLGNITMPQFLAWNPNFSPLCGNTVLFHGYEICVSPPGGYLNHTTDSNPTATTGAGATGVASAPTNAVEGSNRNCSQWYTVVEGDQCGTVSMAQSISLADFYFLNPEIDASCTNLQLGEAYCVQPVGSITSYPNYTISGVLPITVTPVSFSAVNTAIPTITRDPGYIYTPTALLPTASGTIPDCYEYENPFNTTPCRYLAWDHEISTDQLFAWNPSLDTNISTCTLDPAHSYCVLQYQNSTDSSILSETNCLPINATESDTVANCNCFGMVDGYADKEEATCSEFISDYNITMTELILWNPWLTGDCDTALYANLDETATRAVCIGTGTTTATLSPSTTVTGSVSQTTISAEGTPTGVVTGCRKFHTVQKLDDCPSIENDYDITFAQFYAWNPSGNTCTNLWLGWAYCVEGPPSSTTAAATAISSIAPTQTGIASNCNQYYNVIKDDSCAKIETAYDITFTELYKWNPAIGDGCQTLEIGTAVCVGVHT
ncbi:hypothetical protein N7465_001113 [Penicillium sp. CMV-2018d]|nr:hypothetical protein N7465_001113 [Penicillium sp. CMV-2018d]